MESKTGHDKENLIKRSLKYSVIDGTFASMMVGFGESFFSAFAVLLKASNVQLGLLGSLPQFLGSLSQLFSSKLIKLFKSRKKLVCISALLQGLVYVPIALVFFFGTFRVFHLIAFICLYWVFGMLLGPAWNSWMGDLVSEKERGAYFGRRNKITGFAYFLALLLAGYVLQHFTNGVTSRYVGFVAIFSLALISRVVSFIYLAKKYEPEYEMVPEADFSLFSFVKKIRSTNYGLLVIYLCLTNFAVYLSAPFFTAYMLYDLKLSYMTFTIVCAAAVIVKFASMPVWGKASDQFGTRKVLSLSGFLMPLTPILWFFSKDVWYLIIIQMYSGFVWAGVELASFTFILDTTTSQKRATCVSYYNVLNGFALLLGAVIGSIIVMYSSVFWSKYLLVFIISGVLRYVIALIFIPKLKEVRQVDGIPYPRLFLKIISAMTTSGLVHHLITFRKNHGPEKNKQI